MWRVAIHDEMDINREQLNSQGKSKVRGGRLVQEKWYQCQKDSRGVWPQQIISLHKPDHWNYLGTFNTTTLTKWGIFHRAIVLSPNTKARQPLLVNQRANAIYVLLSFVLGIYLFFWLVLCYEFLIIVQLSSAIYSSTIHVFYFRKKWMIMWNYQYARQ